MKHPFRAVVLALMAILIVPVAANAQSCTFHVISRFHVTGADGGDRACVVFQSADCSVTLACAG